MANTHYFIEENVSEDDKFLTVGQLINVLEEVNPETKVFIRNLDEWGEKPVIKGADGFNSYQISDGLIENIIKSNINQVTGEYEYIIIQGCISKEGFVTLDREPYQEVIYHHTWWDKVLKKITPLTTIKQLKDRFNVNKKCANCKHITEAHCSISKLDVNNDDVCELWSCQD